MKVAIAHDWLVTLGGSELVLRELLRIFPDATVFTLIDKMPEPDRSFIGVARSRTSFLDRLPGVASTYRRLLPLFPVAMSALDLGEFDLVISNSHAIAKGVRTRAHQLHLCYCLSPMRYAWDLRTQYLEETGLARGVRGYAANRVLDGLRRWDRATSTRVDSFITLSRYIADRIKRAYGRNATVIYPPVDVGYFDLEPGRRPGSGDYYFTMSRFVPYKRIDLIARAFAQLPERRLVIAGDGPDAAKVRAAAGPNVELVGRVERDRAKSLLGGARAFLFAAEEDFGIAPVEAQARGVPVIAYGRGGALETVRGLDDHAPTGVFFEQQSEAAIVDAVRRFEAGAGRIEPMACRANAERFAEHVFRTEFAAFVDREWRSFRDRRPVA
ncbi:MAG TPA: glycosyltransferase [Gemmatimonadaceae bacterium]|nr:glycosyltransferase [Gemmatimonadaceae bacterium]